MRRKVNAHNLFVLILSVLIIFSVASVAVAMWTSNKMFLSNSFFRRGADIFMDFYNSIRDNADFFTYTERSTIYPPLVAFFFHAIGFNHTFG